ncbi:DUF421 domain-containing protein [Stieleria mannarensis]|uniref:DUF421 domain-containing protein n=1 Tax=Stieleria mannarensis TaxID=2755585 RepID=UPI0016035471|nr:YetF domain-containing protein [Rhodopirellula sp. JC639]
MIATTLSEKWITVSFSQLAMILVSAVVVYTAILTYTRIVGLRSFSKMSAADFAMTIATGSLFGSTISSPSPTLFMGMFAIFCVFMGQWTVAKLRMNSSSLAKAVDNQPMLLMAGREILHENMRQANITEEDLYGKLRESNAMNFDQVKAVVFETTGDVSVIHTADDDVSLDQRIFRDVIGSERLFG